MKRFQVTIKAENLLFDLDGDHHLCGLKAVRFVTAADERLAGKTAISRLLQEPALKEQLVDEGQRRANFSLEEIVELGKFAYFRRKRSATTQYFSVEGESE